MLNPYLYKSTNLDIKPKTMTRALKNCCEEFDFLHVWRYKYPRDQDYTYYAHPHSAYSRIDFFFMPSNEAFRAGDCQIHNITLSDHTPVSMPWNVNRAATSNSWRLNTSLLGMPAFQTSLRDEFTSYMAFNDKDDMSPVILGNG